MDLFRIQGGVPLTGTVPVRPAKNALLPCMAAALLTDSPVTLRDTAELRDIAFMADLLKYLGAGIEGKPGGPMTITASSVSKPEAPYDLVRRMRASVAVLGPLLARFGRARVSLPGGCAIGTRPVDQHLKGLAALGAQIEIEHGYIEARAGKLKGGDVVFDTVSVGATENVLMAAAAAEGTTVIHNAAREPEIGDLARLLVRMGAAVDGIGTDTLSVEGGRSLHGAEHACIPDRVEAGTLLIAALATGGDVTVTSLEPVHLDVLLEKLRAMGGKAEIEDHSVHVWAPGGLASVNVTTAPYPGFPTDLQAQFMALLTQAEGAGTVKETIFENRFMHVSELIRMGADIQVDGNVAVVVGSTPLTGAPVMASDLRASAGLVIAGLCAEGVTEIRRIYHLDRGYERLERRLSALGGRVDRLHEDDTQA
ncbi:MAG: UDP-N-acetylglucosamine 1-carboxyvinyltransferase [Acidobacteriota bacterium]